MSSTSLFLLAALAAPGAAPPPPSLDFCLRDPRGRTHRLGDWQHSKAVVVVFVRVECPLAKLYAPRLTELARIYQPRGIGFVALSHDAPRDLARYARTHAFSFPILRDTGLVVASRFAAERSPEVFVLDATRRVRYRGRIDDRYGVGVQKPAATRHDLVDALEAILSGKPVAIRETKAPGCPLDRPEASRTDVDVSYCRDVVPILQRRCQVCHRAGQVAPFALASHADAMNWAGAIREVVEEGRMPPWSANPRHGKFANDPSLTEKEKQTLYRWIDAGCPEGDRRDLPRPATFPGGWTIPGPDLVVEMPKAFRVPAQGVIEYQHVRVDPGFREDRWVKAAEIIPGNRAVVHHCNIFLQPPGLDEVTDLRTQGKLGSYCLTMTAQGTPPMILPDGMAKRIPAGWRIVFVMHYQAIGSVQEDRTKLGLTFADPKTVQKEVATQLMYDADLRIPPRTREHHVAQTWAVQQDVLLFSFFPHAHLRGKSFRYELIDPQGREEVLLDVPRYDFAWQHRYVLEQPRRIVAGSQIRCSAVFDNSADNPANPNPDIEVRAGMQSWEEMFNGYFDVALADEDLTRPTARLREWAARMGFTPGLGVLACGLLGLVMTRRRLARMLRGEPMASGAGSRGREGRHPNERCQGSTDGIVAVPTEDPRTKT